MPFEKYSSINPKFEKLYIALRSKEGRVYSSDECRKLPYLDKQSKHWKEWRLRAYTLERFLSYLDKKNTSKNLLDIGCGNGWFCHQVSKNLHEVVGVDVNATELEVASKLFGNEQLSFGYYNIFDDFPFAHQFDFITLNAVVQYFDDFNGLHERLVQFLSPGGEIHVMDSPFYPEHQLTAAQARTKQYYSEMGYPELSEFYHHHCIDELVEYECLYQPKLNGWKKYFKKDSPFGWYRFRLAD